MRTRVAKARYLEALRVGMTRGAAAAAAGVHRATTYRWAEQSVAFTKEVEQAESEAVERMEAAFYRAAINGSWRAMLAWLERRLPEKWGPQAALKIELTDERRAAAELIERLQTMTLAEKEAELEELGAFIDPDRSARLLEARPIGSQDSMPAAPVLAAPARALVEPTADEAPVFVERRRPARTVGPWNEPDHSVRMTRADGQT